MLAKFIDKGKHEHEEMEIFIKEFKTTNELLLKTRSNLLSELKIKVNELSKVVSNILIPKNEAKGVTTRGGKMTSEATRKKDPRSFTIPCQVLEKHKEAEDLAADHLSRFENLHMEVLTEKEIADKFSNEHLMVLKSKFNNDEPCGHHSANVTAKKVYESRFYWHSVFKDANEYKLKHYLRMMYPGKLKSKWSGPNIVKTVYPHGAIEITDRDGFSFKVNGQKFKKYYGGNINKEDDEVIEFENGSYWNEKKKLVEYSQSGILAH
ncbi:hypothetical protein Tco_0965864 [Tanacetum coccineum]